VYNYRTHVTDLKTMRCLRFISSIYTVYC